MSEMIEDLKTQVKQLETQLNMVNARLEAHIETLNESLNNCMGLRISLKLTEQSRQEFIQQNSQLTDKIVKLEQDLESAKNDHQVASASIAPPEES